jgi:hypothetical protein
MAVFVDQGEWAWLVARLSAAAGPKFHLFAYSSGHTGTTPNLERDQAANCSHLMEFREAAE